MAAVDSQTYWKLAQHGKLCDLILVEESVTKVTREYKVHRLIMYTVSPYFKAMFDSGMVDSDSPRLTITTEAPETGLLDLVIEAMYATACRAERLYYTFTGEHPISEIMHLYMLCSYLQLTEHTTYIQKGIKDFIPIGELTRWWRDRQALGIAVPDGVEGMVQDHIRRSIKYVGSLNEAYISVDALLNLWSTMEDPISESVRDFLGSLHEHAETLSKEGNDDPNQWMTDESNDEDDDRVVPASSDHPELQVYDVAGNRWIDPATKFIFTQCVEKEWYIDSRLDVETQLARALTVRDNNEAAAQGWRTISIATHVGRKAIKR